MSKFSFISTFIITIYVPAVREGVTYKFPVVESTSILSVISAYFVFPSALNIENFNVGGMEPQLWVTVNVLIGITYATPG